MIEFTQPTEAHVGNTELPAEALFIDGVPIESKIQGYRTLTVEGRELMGQELSTIDRVGMDGSLLTQSKYPQREIVIKYKLEVGNRQQFRESFNKLNKLLVGDSKKLSFNDEINYHFYGALGDADTVPPGTNSVVSSFTFVCSDPFKYSNIKSVQGTSPVIRLDDTYNTLPIKIEIQSSSGGEITVNNGEKRIKLNDTNSGGNIIIDFERFDVRRDGKSIIKNLDITSDFEDFYIVDGQPITTTPSSNIKISYREVEL